MTTQEKKNLIINMLDTHSSVTVSQLSEIFRISDVSVRKLLAAMEQEGLVKRTWGGAISAYGSLNEFSHKEKEWKHTEEKLSIAYAAYECISDGDAVFPGLWNHHHTACESYPQRIKTEDLVGTMQSISPWSFPRPRMFPSLLLVVISGTESFPA